MIFLLFFLVFIHFFSPQIGTNASDFSFNLRIPVVKKQDYYADESIVYLFAHGLGNTGKQAEMFLPNGVIMPHPYCFFNFPDAKETDQYHRKKVNLGQEEDIACLVQAYQETKKCFPQADFIFIGISRGSATILNAAPHLSIKAMVLESPFDTLSSIIQHLLERFKMNWVPFAEKIGYKICEVHFPGLNTNGIFPIDTITNLSKNIPIILIHSKKDKVVPINSSRRLYIKLKQLGHEHDYLAELASGAHGKLVYGPDSDFYLCVVHAFYKKYGLPHNEEYAQRGMPLLKWCQPSIEDVQHRLEKKRTEWSDDEEEKTDITDIMHMFSEEEENSLH